MMCIDACSFLIEIAFCKTRDKRSHWQESKLLGFTKHWTQDFFGGGYVGRLQQFCLNNQIIRNYQEKNKQQYHKVWYYMYKKMFAIFWISRRAYFVTCSPLITSVLVIVESSATVCKNVSRIWVQFPPLSCFLIKPSHHADNGIDRTAYGDPEVCFSTFIWWIVIPARQYHRAASVLNLKEYGKVFLSFNYLLSNKAKYGCSLLYLVCIRILLFLSSEALAPQNGQLQKLCWKTECHILLDLQNLLLIESYGQEKHILHWR